MIDMTLSARDLQDMVAQASTLYERLAWRDVPPEDPRDRAAIERRLERWRQTAASGDEKRFAARLALDGLDPQRVRPYLASHLEGTALPLPPWAETLRSMVEAALAAGPDDRSGYRFLDPAEPVAFEDILAPFVVWASGEVARRAGDATGSLDDHAHVVFENTLLRLLAFQLARSLQVEFSAFRIGRQSSWERLVAQVQPTTSDVHYQAFVHAMLADGLVRFLREHSAAARRAATLTRAWITTTTELLCRLEADREALASIFNEGRDPGQVTDVEAELSDRHNGGRTVSVLTFASGLRLVYKPKQIESEVAYDGFLGWMDAHGAPLPLKRLRLLARPGYGWVEFAVHAPVPDEDAAERFFQRMGALTCVVFALQGNDCHNENIVACGEDPVLVDAETLLHPRPSERELRSDRDILALGYRRLWGSVMSTGILPHWSSTPDGGEFDNSALGGVAGQEIHIERPRWVRINTDAMDIEPAFTASDGAANLPALRDQPLDPAAYRAPLLTGFTRTYRWFMAQRPALLAPDGPLRAFFDMPIRAVLRPTQVYALLMRKITHPDYAAHGIDASIEWELLTRPFDARNEQFGWPVYQAEHRAMSEYDVPYFTTRADSAAIWMNPEERLENFFDTPEYSRAIAAFSEADLAWQLELIRGSFHIRFAGHDDQETPVARRAGSLKLDAVDPLPATELVASAVAIAERLARQAIRSEWGEATWIGTQFDPQSRRHALAPLGLSLYDGTAGIALFLAAVERQTGGAGFRDLALGAIRPLRSGPTGATRSGLGGLIGLGSAIYALLQTGLLLDDERLIADAVRSVELVTDTAIAADDRLDVLSGGAGMLLALLAVHERTGSPLALERAVACGHHLVTRRRQGASGSLAWPTLDGKLLAGFSHGTAGIAYALLNLFGVTGEDAFRAAAREGLLHERSLFDPVTGNWHSYVDSPPADARAGKASWCHGAPGIGLARLASLPWHDTEMVREEIDIALATTRAFDACEVDHLCCGHAGRADVLLEAGRRLKNDDLTTAALRWAASLMTRAQHHEGFRLFHGYPAGGDNPGLFQGTAGIGYALLRCADEADTLPSVLLLDA